MEPKRIFFAIFILSIISFLLLLNLEDSYLYEGPVHLGIFSLAMFFIWKKNLKTTLKSLGIPGDLKKNILFIFGGFFATVMALYIVGSILWAFGIYDQEGVTDVVRSLPPYILAMGILLAPISEELFFRAALVPRIGVLGSSVVFSILHISYGSIAEVAGAFTIGMVFALIFRYSKSIIPSIAIHMMFNFVAIMVMLGYP